MKLLIDPWSEEALLKFLGKGFFTGGECRTIDVLQYREIHDKARFVHINSLLTFCTHLLSFAFRE